MEKRSLELKRSRHWRPLRDAGKWATVPSMIDRRAVRAEFADVPGGNHRPTLSLTESDDQADQMSHALNRLRAMVSLPESSPPMPWPPTGDRGWMA